MLVLTRCQGEDIIIAHKGEIIRFKSLSHGRMRIGVDAPDSAYIYRDNIGCIVCNIHCNDGDKLIKFADKHVIICRWCLQKVQGGMALKTPLGYINKIEETEDGVAKGS